MDFAQTGTLVYRKSSGRGPGMLTIQWVDGAGKKEPLLAKPGAYLSFGVSPDGKRLAFVVTEGGNQDVWAYDPQRDATTRLTFGGLYAGAPIWSPDGRYVVFAAIGKGIYWTRADGAGQPQPLIQSKNVQIPCSFTADGKRLAYFERVENPQIWTVSLEDQGGQLKAGQSEQFLKSQFSDLNPAFSPDGRWVAYVSNESGKSEVYVRAFPPPASGQGGKWQISYNGGSGIQWSRRGHELVYRAGDQVMALNYSVKGDSFMADKPRVRIEKLVGAAWDLSPDGKRVAVLTPVGSTEAPKAEHEVVLLENFFDYLRQRVPVGSK
jgi:serine/threonine-protein kinase